MRGCSVRLCSLPVVLPPPACSPVEPFAMVSGLLRTCRSQLRLSSTLAGSPKARTPRTYTLEKLRLLLTLSHR